MKEKDKSRDTTRRKLLKLAGIAGATAIVLPSSWTKPILRTVVVPAHAKTTPVVTMTTTPTTTTITTTTTATTATVTNGIFQ
jgi:hypothetical protein